MICINNYVYVDIMFDKKNIILTFVEITINKY